MYTVAPTARPLLRPVTDPQSIAFMFAVDGTDTGRALVDRLRTVVFDPTMADDDTYTAPCTAGDPRDLPGDGGYTTVTPTSWRLVRVDVTVSRPETLPDLSNRMDMFVTTMLAAQADAPQSSVLFGWAEPPADAGPEVKNWVARPSLEYPTLYGALHAHLDRCGDEDLEGRQGWYWLLHAFIRRLTPTSAVVNSSALTGGRSWAAEDVLLTPFAQTFLEHSGAVGRSVLADHALLKSTSSRYRDQIDDQVATQITPLLTGGARTGAIEAIQTVTGFRKRLVASMVSARDVRSLATTADVAMIVHGYAGTRRICRSGGLNLAVPIGQAAEVIIRALTDDDRFDITASTVADDTDGGTISWSLSVTERTSGRTVMLNGYTPQNATTYVDTSDDAGRRVVSEVVGSGLSARAGNPLDIARAAIRLFDRA